MFEFDNPEAVQELITRNGDSWKLKAGSLTVHKTVLRYETVDGLRVQTHVSDVATVVSRGSK